MAFQQPKDGTNRDPPPSAALPARAPERLGPSTALQLQNVSGADDEETLDRPAGVGNGSHRTTALTSPATTVSFCSLSEQIMIYAQPNNASALTFYRPVDQTVASVRETPEGLVPSRFVLSASVVLLVVVLLGLISHIPALGAT